MKSSLKPILSGLAGIALLAFTTASAAFAGFGASSTLLGVGAFVLWGLWEIARVDYVPRTLRSSRRVSVAAAAAANSTRTVLRFTMPVLARRAA